MPRGTLGAGAQRSPQYDAGYPTPTANGKIIARHKRLIPASANASAVWRHARYTLSSSHPFRVGHGLRMVQPWPSGSPGAATTTRAGPDGDGLRDCARGRPSPGLPGPRPVADERVSSPEPEAAGLSAASPAPAAGPLRRGAGGRSSSSRLRALGCRCPPRGLGESISERPRAGRQAAALVGYESLGYRATWFPGERGQQGGVQPRRIPPRGEPPEWSWQAGSRTSTRVRSSERRSIG